MEIKNMTVRVETYDESENLPEMYGYLLSEAGKALSGSYAPYSEFHVGAAVLLENGQVVQGSNQENAAYPSGLCAERVALFHAQTMFPGVPVKMIAITAKTNHFVTNQPVTPCGACRQVMAEVEKRQSEKITVVMRGQTGPTFAIKGIDELLPLLFHEEKLKKVNK